MITDARKARIAALLMGAVICSAAWRSANPTDPVTGLPLHPGLAFPQEVNSAICGHKAQMNLYDAPATATLAEYVEWYRGQLKGAHYVHKVWSDRAQEMFYSADGLTGVTITGRPSDPGVFAVAYLRTSVALTIPQMDAFSPSNPACK